MNVFENKKNDLFNNTHTQKHKNTKQIPLPIHSQRKHKMNINNFVNFEFKIAYTDFKNKYSVNIEWTLERLYNEILENTRRNYHQFRNETEIKLINTSTRHIPAEEGDPIIINDDDAGIKIIEKFNEHTIRMEPCFYIILTTFNERLREECIERIYFMRVRREEEIRRQECGVCFETQRRPEFLTIPGCTHQICRTCYIRMGQSGLNRCPFCRQRNPGIQTLVVV